MSEKRKAELEQYTGIWLTKKSYDLLKKQKKIQSKSMARIVNDLIEEKYGKRNN